MQRIYDMAMIPVAAVVKNGTDVTPFILEEVVAVSASSEKLNMYWDL